VERLPVSDPTPGVLPVRRLLVWRHGRTPWNAAGRFQGHLDPPLDAVGEAQARAAAPHLRAAGLSAADTVVVSSDLVRAVATAEALTGLLGIPLRIDGRLREHGMGSWEGLTRDEVAERYPDQYADWTAGRPVRGRGGEEPEQVGDRALAALADLPPVAVAVVVTHGGTAGRLVERLLGLGSDHRRVIGPLANCAWSELLFQGTRWRLLRHNSAVLDGVDGVAGVDDAVGGRRDRAGDLPAGDLPAGGVPAGDADAVA
jgi:glucosyl-3-phosphoglycerate phosphatase